MPEQSAIFTEVIKALELCKDRIEMYPFSDIVVRVHDSKPTVVEITTRHRTKSATRNRDGVAR